LMVNLQELKSPIFLKTEEDFLRQPSKTCFVAQQDVLERFPKAIADNLEVSAYGTIGHKNCVLFFRKEKRQDPKLFPKSNLSTVKD